MTSKVIYYKDAATSVSLTVTEYTHTIERSIQVTPGNAGANTYQDSVRYVQRWQVTAVVNRVDAEKLRDYADETFDANTKLRVYDNSANPFYNDYTGVKLTALQLVDLGGMERFRATLTVVK